MEKLMDGKPRDLKLGESFGKDGMAFHSIRYDFQPASVDVTKMAAVEIQEKNSVTVTVPHLEGSGTLNTVYKGNKRPVQKECVLIFDHNTGQLSLEKLSNTIQLKKTSEVACELVGYNNKDSNNNTEREDLFKGSRLVQFAKQMYPDIVSFFEQHKRPQKLRPIIKLSYGPEKMKAENPEIYNRIKLRTKVKQDELDALMSYLVKEFPQYLTGTMNIYQNIDWLEDVCDFVLDRVMQARLKQKKKKH